MDPLTKLVSWMLERGECEAVLEYLRRDQALVPEFRVRRVTFGGANSLDNFIAHPDHSVDWLLWGKDLVRNEL
jgi:hypothetical protein